MSILSHRRSPSRVIFGFCFVVRNVVEVDLSVMRSYDEKIAVERIPKRGGIKGGGGLLEEGLEGVTGGVKVIREGGCISGCIGD